MVVGKKIGKDLKSVLPSVQEVKDAEQESEGGSFGSYQLGGISSRPPSRPRRPFSRGSVGSKTVSRTPSAHSAHWEREKNRGVSAAQELKKKEANTERSARSSDEGNVGDDGWETDLEIEEAKAPSDATGRTSYLGACKKYGVVPISFFLRHMLDCELVMEHHGLGPKGAKALSVPLVSNTSILKLNLRDNWLEGNGGAAIAEMLKENCYITEVDLSDNKLGYKGAQAISAMLKENTSLVKVLLSGNEFDDRTAEPLAEAFMTNQKLECMDLSHNVLGDKAGEILGNAIGENTGMKELDLSWNCLRGKGAIAIAKGLEANIFLRVLDLSYNGFGKGGAAALGEAVKVNNVVEELNISNNRISPEGAVLFAMGLRENKTLRVLNMARNPMQSAGCYGILKAMQGNPATALESLDFSNITVNKDFDELYTAVKELFTNLEVKHGGNADMFSKKKPKADPLTKLKQYVKENKLQLVEFFETVGEDRSTLITRLEFQQGLQKAGIPLSEQELQQLMDFLDKDKNGEIDFSNFNQLLNA
nr:PREDICTED: leucine-rich repeat-containing protein 74B isoform X2 [Latimeria chalumnae]|eukprot:XP_005990309.1 PREDICTED: leucine-rich repeat-containing protein 74B isoform X2 [Latimeria chalumnae]